MKKFKLNTPCLLDSFKDHKKLKDTLVSLIKETKADYLNEQQDYYSDLIHRLDWSQSKDKNREWVKHILPSLQNHFVKLMLNDIIIFSRFSFCSVALCIT